MKLSLVRVLFNDVIRISNRTQLITLVYGVPSSYSLSNIERAIMNHHFLYNSPVYKLGSQYRNELYHQELGSVLFEWSSRMNYDICDEFLDGKAYLRSQSEKIK